MEDHLHFFAQILQHLAVRLRDIFPVENDLTVSRGEQVKDYTAHCRFPTAGFAYDTQGFALLQRKVDIINGMEHTLWSAEILFKTFNFQQSTHLFLHLPLLRIQPALY